MKTLTHDQARRLAVAYAAYASAKDDRDVFVWGNILLDDQRELGLDMMDPDRLEARVEDARKRLHPERR